MTQNITINNYDTHIAISPTDSSNRIDHIPAMVYIPTMTQEGKLILIKDRPRFNTPTVKYGDHNHNLKTLTEGYDVGSKSHGVIMVGVSGGGKSMLAEDLGNWFIKQDIPVLMITSNIPHQLISLAINAMGPCMVYIDEIGKLYDLEEQSHMLSMFSSSEFTGVSFVITANRIEELHQYFINRPQRFRYYLDFNSILPTATVTDILREKQVNSELHEAFYYYTEEQELSMDALLTAVNQSAGITCVNELSDKLKPFNIPTFPFIGWSMIGCKQTLYGEAVDSPLIHYRIDADPDEVRNYGLSVTLRGGNSIEFTPANTTLRYIPEHKAIQISGEAMGVTFEVYLTHGLTSRYNGVQSTPLPLRSKVRTAIRKQNDTLSETFGVKDPYNDCSLSLRKPTMAPDTPMIARSRQKGFMRSNKE